MFTAEDFPRIARDFDERETVNVSVGSILKSSNKSISTNFGPVSPR